MPNPDKPEKIQIPYHESTKARKHEKLIFLFRVFIISCFRDYLIILYRNKYELLIL